MAWVEASHRSAQDQLTIAIHAVADLETHLLLQEPWTVESLQYKDTIKYIHQCQYHWALDKLEQLVAQQLFKLSKANVLGMGKLQPITYMTYSNIEYYLLGYKVCELISHALKTQGKAIHTALNNYNNIALKMDLLALILQWRHLMEYNFISEFELPKHAHSHHDITTEPWVLPLNCEMALKHHKINWAHEEMHRIHYKAPQLHTSRLHTSIHDEDILYTQHIDCLHESNPSLAFVLERIWAVQWHINNTHMEHLNALECLDGYAGIQGAGVHKDKSFVDNKEELQCYDFYLCLPYLDLPHFFLLKPLMSYWHHYDIITPITPPLLHYDLIHLHLWHHPYLWLHFTPLRRHHQNTINTARYRSLNLTCSYLVTW